MKRYLQHSFLKRAVALSLAIIQVLIVAPVEDLGAAIVAEMQKPAPVRANRTVPPVTPISPFPVFSARPSDEEITRARVFEEPLVPMTGKSSEAANRQLANALSVYLRSGNPEDLSLLETFLHENPDSVWRASLWTDMGIVYRRTGYFSKALKTWEQAWELSKNETAPMARAIANRTLAEYAELSARLGRYEILEPLFEETKDRPIGGSPAEKLHGAKQGLWLMNNRPQDAFRCGPMALDRILAFQQGAAYKGDERLLRSESTRRGMSLPEVMALGNKLGMNLQMAIRSRSAEVLLPAVVHWKAGHYAALLKEENGRYLVQDPTFGDELWVSRQALEEESSGYFLVRAGDLPQGWKPVGQTEGGLVWGKGNTSSDNPEAQTCRDEKAKGCTTCGRGMAVYDIHLMLVNLNITDIPLGYAPPRGPSVDFRLTYNHRDAFQPAIFSYSNVGPKWTFDWLAYITDNPSNLTASVTHYVQGGGQETYSGYNAGTQSYAPHYRSRAVVVRTSSSPIRYEMRMPDGSIRVFAQPDGAATFPRKVFMTEWIDAVGNSLTFTYDSSLRLAAVTDAIGQVTTLSYELSGDPLKITRVTDPFGRYAVLQYNADGRLQSITDQIGLQSSFEYTSSDFIRTMTTPYGKTTFQYGEEGSGVSRTRWIEATDPLGGGERVEFRQGAPGISSTEPSAVVPVGMSTMNACLNCRNTFYWDKRALSLYRGDYTKAQITHWLHEIDWNVTSGVIESTKQPLENRVWYQYPGQSYAHQIGSASQPTKIGRVLDDGTTQLIQLEYNSAGKVIKATDPLGRETVYVYGTNNTPDPTPSTGTGLDLLEIKQKNGAGYDVLASFTYNSQHQPLTSTDAALQVSTATYNSNGDLATIVTAPRGGLTEAQRTTTYEYYADNAPLGPGRPKRIVGPVTGATTDFAYDDHGRLATVTASDGYALTTTYDNFDRPTSIVYPDSTSEQIAYDKLDVSATRDRLGRWTHYFHDAEGRLVSTVDPQGQVVTNQWCNCGSLKKIVDGNGNTTSWELDAQGRVIKEVRADSTFTAFVYENATSRLKRRTNRKGEHTDYTYFKDNNINTISYPNPGQPTSTVSFTYEAAYNRLLTMVDGIGTTTYSYNPITSSPGTLGAGAMASIDGPLANDTIVYGYDELGRVSASSINGTNARLTFDPLGRVSAATNALGTFTYGYVNQTARLQGVAYPNGQTIEFSYFNNTADRRLQQIHNKLAGGATLSKFDYAYDPAGHLTTWTQQRDDGALAVSRAYDFGYDRADQLTLADYRTTGAVPAVLTRYVYNYDGAGNRRSEQIDDAVLQANYDNMNRMTSRTPGGPLYFAGTLDEAAAVTIQAKPAEVSASNQFNATAVVPSGTTSIQITAKDYSGNLRTNTYDVVQSGASASYTYDDNGNLTGDGARSFEWDAENRLLAIEAGTHRSEFTYDGLGRRVRIVEKENAATVSDHWYLWCGLAVCEERDSTGANVLKRFFGQGELIGSTPYFYTTDHLGSVREMTDSSGTIQARYDYDPYGRRTKLSGSLEADFGYTGHYAHAASGLALSLFRAYDANLGRWISEDPAGLEGGLNFYAYAANAPGSFIDPLGLAIKDCLAGLAKGFVGGLVGGFGGAFVLGAAGAVFGSGVAVGLGVALGAAGLLYLGYQVYKGWSSCWTASEWTEFVCTLVGASAGAMAAGPLGFAAGRAVGGALGRAGGTAGGVGAGAGTSAGSGAGSSSGSGTGPSGGASSGGTGGAGGGASGGGTGGAGGGASGGTGTGYSDKVQEIINQIIQSGAKVKLNPKTATQEGNVTIDFGEGVRVNLRVETHALSRNGPPIRHANVETIIKSLRSKSIENVHITD
jgi:RHS repeat-associated protein